MKNNQEVAASVFEKSRAVLKKRAETRKRIATAAATLGAAVIITAVAILGKNAVTDGGNIPTQSASVPEMPQVSSMVVSDNEPDTSAVSEKIYDNTTTSSAVQSRSDNTSHKDESSTSRAQRIQSSATVSSSKRSATSSAASTVHHRVTTTTTTYDDGSDIDSGAESKNTNSRSASSKSTSSRTTSSKATSSRTTSSRTTSSRTTSSRTTSSGTTSSRVSSFPVTTSRPVVESRPSEPSTDTKPEITSTDSELQTEPETDAERPEFPTDRDATDVPDAPCAPNPPDTDVPAADNSEYYYTAYDYDYFTAEELVEYSDRIVTATVKSVDFVSMSEEYEFLKDGVTLTDDSGYTEDQRGDVVAIYTLLIRDEYTPGIVPYNDDDLPYHYDKEVQLYVYGGKEEYKVFDQLWALGGARAIPILSSMPSLDVDRDYLILITYQNGLNTLTRYDQSIFDLNEDRSFGWVTADQIIDICRPE